MEVVKKYKFFEIIRASQDPKRKTGTYIVYSRSQEWEIGRIKWYGSWRQYCFYPETGTVWSDGCLEDIQGFLGMLREQRACDKR